MVVLSLETIATEAGHVLTGGPGGEVLLPSPFARVAFLMIAFEAQLVLKLWVHSLRLRTELMLLCCLCLTLEGVVLHRECLLLKWVATQSTSSTGRASAPDRVSQGSSVHMMANIARKALRTTEMVCS